MNIKSILTIVVSIFLISACNNSSIEELDLSEKDKIALLEASGELPTLDRTDTLEGIDLNNDGIRDDIEAFINTVYTDPAEIAAIRQTAKTIQKIIIVDKENAVEVRKTSLEETNALNCMNDTMKTKNYSKSYTEIESLTTNTKKRLVAYLEFSVALDGTTFSLPTGDTCE